MKDSRCHFVEMFIHLDILLVDVQGRKFILGRKFRQNHGMYEDLSFLFSLCQADNKTLLIMSFCEIKK